MSGELMYDLCYTDELEEKIAQCNPALICSSLGEYFEDLLKRHHMQKLSLIKQAHLDRSYGYQILRGSRRASRDIYIKLALVMKLPMEDVQEMLSVTQTGVLYCRNARDAVICFAIDQQLGLEAVEKMLEELGYRGLE